MFAPFLLTRTDASVRAGLIRYAGATRRLGLKSGVRADWRLPFRLVALGASSLAIKLLTGLENLGRRPVGALQAIPKNFRFYIACADLRAPAELVPGAAGGIAPDGRPVLAASDLRSDYTTVPGSTADEYLDNRLSKNTLITAVGWACLGVFFVVAILYRWSIKASLLVYWPFLLFTPARSRPKFDAGTKQIGWIGKSLTVSLQIGIGLFSLDYVLKRGAPETSALLARLIDDHAPAMVRDAIDVVAQFPPDLPFVWLTVCLLLQAGAYLVSLGPLWNLAAHKATEEDLRTDYVMRGAAGLATLARMVQNVFLALASVYFFLWALPYTDDVLRGLSEFFGRLAGSGAGG